MQTYGRKPTKHSHQIEYRKDVKEVSIKLLVHEEVRGKKFNAFFDIEVLTTVPAAILCELPAHTFPGGPRCMINKLKTLFWLPDHKAFEFDVGVVYSEVVVVVDVMLCTDLKLLHKFIFDFYRHFIFL